VVVLLVMFAALSKVVPLAPVMNQICTIPLLGFCHARSGTPSPLKSAVATKFQGLDCVTSTAVLMARLR
jgi:hypothetical protein